LINDLAKQHLLKDRRCVYKTLQDSNVSVPKHVTVNRSDEEVAGEKDPEGFEEDADYVVMNGVKIDKPFVEKPVDGDDHNIYIYYPHSMVSNLLPPSLPPHLSPLISLRTGHTQFQETVGSTTNVCHGNVDALV
jgi:hypothetical protein